MNVVGYLDPISGNYLNTYTNRGLFIRDGAQEWMGKSCTSDTSLRQK